MRQLVIDELSQEDMRKLCEHLEENALTSGLEGLFWVELDPDLLTQGQAEAAGDHPFCFAVELGEDWAKFELLVRSRPNMQSLHTGYADARQQEFILQYAAQTIEKLGLKT